ncbi:MAG: hypothetical protein AB1716_15495, partial [Planctomycetota bacterium]
MAAHKVEAGPGRGWRTRRGAALLAGALAATAGAQTWSSGTRATDMPWYNPTVDFAGPRPAPMWDDYGWDY